MIAERVANSYWNGFCPTYYSEREEEIRKKMQRGKCENCPNCKECTGQSSCENNENENQEQVFMPSMPEPPIPFPEIPQPQMVMESFGLKEITPSSNSNKL